MNATILNALHYKDMWGHYQTGLDNVCFVKITNKTQQQINKSFKINIEILFWFYQISLNIKNKMLKSIIIFKESF